MKKVNISQQEKNLYLFYNNYWMNADFRTEANIIYNKWNLPVSGESTKECLLKFIERDGEKKVVEFVNDLKKMANKFNLGNNWLDFLGHYFLKGDEFLIEKMPLPRNSFWVSDINASKENKVIKLEIGPYTTLREIKDFWPQIEKMQKAIWPKVKKEKISSKSLDKMVISLNSDLEKYRQSKLIEFVDKKNNYYEILAKATDKMIVNRMISSTDDSADISLNEEIKRVNRIRQIRRRHK